MVTGATGFIGRQCVLPLLDRGFEVHCVTSSPPKVATARGVTWHVADLMSPTAVGALCREIEPSHLLHLAWYTEPGQFWSSSENLRWVAASVGLFAEFQKCGGQRVVGAGTCAEYEWGGVACDENETPLRPATLYGVSKNAVREILEAYSSVATLSQAWGRVFFLFGPHEPAVRLVPAVIGPLLRGERAKCSHGRQVRDFLHSTDVADAFVGLLDSSVTGAVNIASGAPLSIRELVERIERRLGRSGDIDFDALPASSSEPAILTAATSRLNEEVGWRPRLALDDAIDQTIGWWRDQER